MKILFCVQCQRMQGLCPSRYSVACNVHLSPGLVPLSVYIFPWQISQSSGFSIFGVSNTQVLFPQLFSVASQVFCSGTCHILGLGGSLKLWEKIHNLFTPLCIFPSWKTLPSSEAILGQILVPSSHIGSSDYYCCFVGVEHSLGLFLFKLEVLAPKAPFPLFQCRSGLFFISHLHQHERVRVHTGGAEAPGLAMLRTYIMSYRQETVNPQWCVAFEIPKLTPSDELPLERPHLLSISNQCCQSVTRHLNI